MEMFASIDRTISEKILTFWISKFGPHLEVANTLRSHEYLYLTANTTNRTKFIERFVVKPAMDLSRDPNLTYTFKLNQEDLRNQRSLNVQVQHAFNHMHHPDHTVLISKFSFGDGQKEHRKEKKNKMLAISMSVTKLKRNGTGGLRNQLEQQNQFMKQLQAFKVQTNPKNMSPARQVLRDPQIYPEIAAKVASLNQLLRRSRYNSGKNGQAGYIESEVNAVHETRYLEHRSVQDYLESDTHLNHKTNSIKGFKFRYMSSLIDGNLANRNLFFGGLKSTEHETQGDLESELNRSQDRDGGRQIQSASAHRSGLYNPSSMNLAGETSAASGKQLSASKPFIVNRPMTSGSKRPTTGATRPWTGYSQNSQLHRGLSAMTKGGDTRIEGIVDRELAFFEQGL